MILSITLDEKHRKALKEVLETARDTFDFSGRDDDNAVEEVLDDILEAINE